MKRGFTGDVPPGIGRRFPGLALLVLIPGIAIAQPVIFDVNTNHPTDTIYLGNPAEIVFYADAGPYQAQAFQWLMRVTFSNALAFDSLAEGINFFWSPQAESAFVMRILVPQYSDVETPDTLWFDGVSFAAPWTGAGWFTRIRFDPQDTGTIFFDSVTTLPANHMGALDPTGAQLPLDWRPGHIVVAPCPWVVGDLNGNGVVTLGDIIVLVNYVFKSGDPPQPYELMGDADCSLEITTADIIYLINYQGKGGPAPCPCFIPPET